MNGLILLDEKPRKKRKFLLSGVICLFLAVCGVLLSQVMDLSLPGATSDLQIEQQVSKTTDITAVPDYGTSCKIALGESQLYFNFSNPKATETYYRIRILNEKDLLVASDAIEPGYRIETLKLNNQLVSKLQPGMMDGILIVQKLDIKSGEVKREQEEYLAITITE